MKAVAMFIVLLAIAGCSTVQPTPDPGQVLHLVNNSGRAVMLETGSILDDQPPTAARPCGGEVSVAVTPASYEEDGRLIAALAIDPSGNFDVALRDYVGDPVDMPGTFTASLIWSDGTLAGRLPIYLTVASDLTVASSSEPSPQSASGCVPTYP